MGYQIIRSSDSIAANIAEGYGRYTPEYKSIKAKFPRSTFRERLLIFKPDLLQKIAWIVFHLISMV
ncbi:MAG: four helix bundle protein [Thermodesulfobacteriota bacterium]|nr:four helix bundle protein [Thermodesulfobacteriota bacterium]